MTVIEAKDFMREGTAVMYNGICYKRIQAIIYRRPYVSGRNGRSSDCFYQVELLDTNEMAVVIADPAYVTACK